MNGFVIIIQNRELYSLQNFLLQEKVKLVSIKSFEYDI